MAKRCLPVPIVARVRSFRTFGRLACGISQSGPWRKRTISWANNSNECKWQSTAIGMPCPSQLLRASLGEFTCKPPIWVCLRIGYTKNPMVYHIYIYILFPLIPHQDCQKLRANSPFSDTHIFKWRFPQIGVPRNHLTFTSSTAQGGGGSFNNRKPIGEVGGCESGMAERSHWWTERCLRSPLFLSLSDYLSMYLCIYVSIYLSIYRSVYLSM